LKKGFLVITIQIAALTLTISASNGIDERHTMDVAKLQTKGAHVSTNWFNKKPHNDTPLGRPSSPFKTFQQYYCTLQSRAAHNRKAILMKFQ
jgi:hypothetical protein